DPRFASLLAGHYPQGIRFEVNGRTLPMENEPLDVESAVIEVRLARKRKPNALGILIRSIGPLPEAERGIAISTLGKVIKRGWDWIGISPAAHDRMTGLIEVPALGAC